MKLKITLIVAALAATAHAGQSQPAPELHFAQALMTERQKCAGYGCIRAAIIMHKVEPSAPAIMDFAGIAEADAREVLVWLQRDGVIVKAGEGWRVK